MTMMIGKKNTGTIIGKGKKIKMKAKDFLQQLKKLDYMIQNKIYEKEQWKTIAMGTTAQMGSERVQSSGSQQKMADAIGKYVDMEKEIDRIIDALVDTRNDVLSVIERLNVTEYDVLHKRYVQYMSFDEIAAAYDRSTSWSTTIHGRALKKVQKILDARKG